MKRFVYALLAGIFAGPAEAALKSGATAPAFTTQATLAGKEFTFSLAEALKSGPVVLFFYPKAFTSGCTIEAHMFADASDQFKELGATVLGVSNDNIETLNKFSVEACQNKVALAADGSGKIIKSYDAALLFSYANRTSVVIAPDGTVVYTYTALDPDAHVANTMDAVKKWRAAQPRG